MQSWEMKKKHTEQRLTRQQITWTNSIYDSESVQVKVKKNLNFSLYLLYKNYEVPHENFRPDFWISKIILALTKLAL